MNGRTAKQELARMLFSVVFSLPPAARPVTYHVMPHRKRGYQIHRSRSMRCSGFRRMHLAAVAFAVHLASKTHGVVCIHNEDATVRRTIQT